MNWFLPALTIVFITLKLTNYITWSWWWIFAPLWGPFAFALIVAALFYIYSKVFE